ncbi:hypothetical protein ACHAWF_017978, partial [Thalassiosira exigua]
AVIAHVRSLPASRQRRAVRTGLRVKVRFVKRATVHGRLTRRLKWYGGTVTGTARGGRRIRIEYDDGTSEVADFPDKDIVVDDEGNGRHQGEEGRERGTMFRPSTPLEEEKVGGGGEDEKPDRDEGSEESGEVHDVQSPKARSEVEPSSPRHSPSREEVRARGVAHPEEDDEEGASRGRKKKAKKKKKKAKKRPRAESDASRLCDPEERAREESEGPIAIEAPKGMVDPDAGLAGGANGDPPGDGAPAGGSGTALSPSDMSVGSVDRSTREDAAVAGEGPRGGASPSDMSISGVESAEALTPARKGGGTIPSAGPRDEGPLEEEEGRGGALSKELLASTDQKGAGGGAASESSSARPLDAARRGDDGGVLSGRGSEKDATGAPAPPEPVGDIGPTPEPRSKDAEEGKAESSARERVDHHDEEGDVKFAEAASRPLAGASIVAAAPSAVGDVEKVLVSDSSKKNAEECLEGNNDNGDGDEGEKWDESASLAGSKEALGGDEAKAEENGALSPATAQQKSPPLPRPVAPGPSSSLNPSASEATPSAGPSPERQAPARPLPAPERPGPEKKKRGPLSIRIGLPGAKRKRQMMEEEQRKRLDGTSQPSTPTAATASLAPQGDGSWAETGKQTQVSLSGGTVLGDADAAEMPASPLERKEPLGLSGNEGKVPNQAAAVSNPEESRQISVHCDGRASLSEGEIEEEAGSQAKKYLESKVEDSASPFEELKQSSSSLTPPVAKKPKLSIHISTKKRKKHQEGKESGTALVRDDGELPGNRREEKRVEEEDRVKQSPDASAVETDHAAPKPTDGQESPSVSADNAVASTSAGKGADELPSSAGTSPRTASPVTPAAAIADDSVAAAGTASSRAGRRAAKRAAERIITEKKPATEKKPSEKKSSEKKSKKAKNNKHAKGAKKKAEEDPWVQCDRCHKWRHLPGTIDLDSLPEHWFCELNTYDPQRDNCEAPEQTPKEVAKEKKRAKKAALRKLQREEALLAKEFETEAKSGRKGRTSPKNGSDQEAEFDSSKINMQENSTLIESDDRDDDTTNPSFGESSKLPFKPKGKRGRPRREDIKEKASKSGGKDEPKQEWVQCEKCEKWRRLPPRIAAKDLPDVWYCSMNTWDINLATCTAIEDKHEANSPARGGAGATGPSVTDKNYSEQSQIPTSFVPTGKLSYRNLIFGSGTMRRQKNYLKECVPRTHCSLRPSGRTTTLMLRPRSCIPILRYFITGACRR